MSRSTEENDKQRRRRNVIVYGLSPRENVDDSVLFLNFCNKHLKGLHQLNGREKCRRIDQPKSGKIQRFVVVCDSETTRDRLLEAGKSLRSSPDEHVRRHVYFNPDLTPLEAKQAYEERKQRREAQKSGTALRQLAADIDRYYNFLAVRM